MKKAEEARKASIESVSTQIDEINERIKNACKIGNISVTVSDLKPATRVWLEENGYKVDMNYNFYNISW
jgi:hypothetical protein